MSNVVDLAAYRRRKDFESFRDKYFAAEAGVTYPFPPREEFKPVSSVRSDPLMAYWFLYPGLRGDDQ